MQFQADITINVDAAIGFEISLSFFLIWPFRDRVIVVQ